MQPIRDASMCFDQMAIVEKFERVEDYLYPIMQSIPSKHGRAKNKALDTLLDQAELFYIAGKSNQISKIYDADRGLAVLRRWLRFMFKHRMLSKKQLETSQALVAEVGAMLNAWIKRHKGIGQAGK